MPSCVRVGAWFISSDDIFRRSLLWEAPTLSSKRSPLYLRPFNERGSSIARKSRGQRPLASTRLFLSTTITVCPPQSGTTTPLLLRAFSTSKARNSCPPACASRF